MMLSNVVYRSRATSPFSGHDLLHLTRAAQARNRTEAITGLVLHDEGFFYQWLEGPDDSLARVMASITNDRRHTDIEILGRGTMRQRTFDGWTMKLAVPRSLAVADAVQPPTHLIEELRRRPDQAVTALAELAPAPLRTSMCLESLIWARVFPELAARHGIGGAGVHPRAAELAGLLLQDAVEPVESLLRQAAGETGSLLSLRTRLLEPAARRLGDMWLDDACSEIELLLGLGLMQSAVRRLAGVRSSEARRRSMGRVLVALLPGETHVPGVALASDTLHEAGWGVTVAFPPDTAALVAQFRSERFDALHLALSDALPREESLPSLTRAVRMARSAAGKRKVRITVGGRMFAENSIDPERVGADGLLPATA